MSTGLPLGGGPTTGRVSPDNRSRTSPTNWSVFPDVVLCHICGSLKPWFHVKIILKNLVFYFNMEPRLK